MMETVAQSQTDLFAQLKHSHLDMCEPGGWTGREILSHIIGSWQRVPVWSSFYLDGDATTPVPIYPHDPFNYQFHIGGHHTPQLQSLLVR